MKKNEKLSWIGWVATALIVAACASSSASAQCPDVCNRSAEHWTFTGLIGSGSDTITLGMWRSSNGRYYPAACRYDAASGRWGMWTEDGHPGFTSRQLANDTSLCLGGGDDTIGVLGYNDTLTCYVMGSAMQLIGFDDAGYRLAISGESGNDTISVFAYAAPTTLCGAAGNDKLIGDFDYQYMNAGDGNDGLDGRRDSDTLLGGNGYDVLVHTNTGVDYLLGDADGDCVELGASTYRSSSTCGSGTDRYSYEQSMCFEKGLQCVAPPSSCETGITQTCCSLSGRTCPL